MGGGGRGGGGVRRFLHPLSPPSLTHRLTLTLSFALLLFLPPSLLPPSLTHPPSEFSPPLALKWKSLKVCLCTSKSARALCDSVRRLGRVHSCINNPPPSPPSPFFLAGWVPLGASRGECGRGPSSALLPLWRHRSLYAASTTRPSPAFRRHARTLVHAHTHAKNTCMHAYQISMQQSSGEDPIAIMTYW